MTPRKLAIREQCERLAQDAAQLYGMAAWYEQTEAVLSDEEQREVKQLWDTMPGSTCWIDAFFQWMTQP